MSGNGDEWHCTIKEAGLFYCAVVDSDGILHIMPEGRKKIERYEDRVVVIIDPEGRNEKRFPFIFKKKNEGTLGVEFIFSDKKHKRPPNKWQGKRI
jgi:hypothetical protein